jgi:hypothetical protein
MTAEEQEAAAEVRRQTGAAAAVQLWAAWQGSSASNN